MTPLLFISLRQSQTITAQKAAASVAAGTAIGAPLFIRIHERFEINSD
jgi:hypothetical protein